MCVGQRECCYTASACEREDSVLNVFYAPIVSMFAILIFRPFVCTYNLFVVLSNELRFSYDWRCNFHPFVTLV